MYSCYGSKYIITISRCSNEVGNSDFPGTLKRVNLFFADCFIYITTIFDTKKEIGVRAVPRGNFVKDESYEWFRNITKSGENVQTVIRMVKVKHASELLESL